MILKRAPWNHLQSFYYPCAQAHLRPADLRGRGRGRSGHWRWGGVYFSQVIQMCSQR